MGAIMDKKFLALLVDDNVREQVINNPQRLEQVMGLITDELGTRTEPFDIGNNCLTTCYTVLKEEVPKRYLEMDDPERRSKYARNNLESLAMLEFQASWHVLKDYIKEEAIQSLTPKKRYETFLVCLYANKDKHPFFEQREKALQALESAGLINAEDFRPKAVSYKAPN
jgi:hypothetical protein